MGWVESALDGAAAAHPNPGRTEPFHRLNRAEYRNVVRDLLGLDIDVAEKRREVQEPRGGMLTGAEDDVTADGVCACTGIVGQLRGGGVVVKSYAGQVVTDYGFEERT